MTAGISPSNQQIIRSWQLSLHNRATTTAALYKGQVTRFAGWLETTGAAEGDLLQAVRSDCDGYITGLKDEGYKPNTISTHWAALRSFYSWAHEEEEVAENPMERVTVTRPEPPPPKTPSTDLLQAVLKTCTGKGFVDRRDAAILRLMSSAGLRLAENAGLALPDVELEPRLVQVLGKGGKVRVARFDPKAATAVDRYLRVRARHKHAASSALWLGRSSGRFTASGMYQMIVRRGASVGIHIHPHLLRHYWGHSVKQAGMSDEAAMLLGGWSSADMLRRYGQSLAIERALAAYDETNPVGDL